MWRGNQYFSILLGCVSGSGAHATTSLRGLFFLSSPTTSACPMCVGDGQSGQLGTGYYEYSPYPAVVTNPEGVDSWSQVSASDRFTCAVAVGGSAYCFGTFGDACAHVRALCTCVHVHILQLPHVTWSAGYGDGRLGTGFTDWSPSPVSVTGSVTSWSQVSTGDGHSCAIASGTAAAWCWGAYRVCVSGLLTAGGELGCRVPALS